MTAPRPAVLLLAYGGPDRLEDIPAYLLDIRGGRHTPQHLIDEITDRYAQIGGKSPLLEITREVAEKLSARLNMPVYVGMRHWTPYIKDAVAQMAQDGVTRAVVICMAPHYSRMSIGAYRRKLDEAIQATGATFQIDFVESWHTQPDYLAGVAANAQATLQLFPEDVRAGVKVVFTAHSLPAIILEQGDPYDAQLRETASLLAERLRLPEDRWTFCYQSAAQTGTPWLGPQIEELIPTLAREGERHVLVVPIGFIADHVEVLYDLDIGVQQIAREHGLQVLRPPMLNASEPLIRALEQLVAARFQPES
ncbi:MAG: ferrochelatase [Anaerolineae bacterium]